MPRGKKAKLKFHKEAGTSWITIRRLAWVSNKYSTDYVDAFNDVWLKPVLGHDGLYVTVLQPDLYFRIDEDCLIPE